MHFACASEKSVSDSIPGRAGAADSNVVLGSVCKWDAPVELWEQFQIHLALMWVKTNRTKTESMDINTMLVYF